MDGRWWRPSREVLRRDVGAGKGVIRKFREEPFRRCPALDVKAAALLGYDKAAFFKMVKCAVCSIAADVQNDGGFSNAVWDFAVVGIKASIATRDLDVESAGYRIERLPCWRHEHPFHQTNVAALAFLWNAIAAGHQR
jgi:hypothetical protein